MLKEIMSPGGEIKSGKMGSKIYCVILHALSKRNVAVATKFTLVYGPLFPILQGRLQS